MRYTFQEISITATKNGICAVCGKKATRKETFLQTINPFNKNTDGTLKTKKQINSELAESVKAWRSIPCKHLKCSDC